MRIAPAGWALVVVSSGFALVSAVVYLLTGEFSQGWLVASVIVYGLVVLGAVLLAALDRAPERTPASAPVTAAPRGEPTLVARETIYSTAAGDAIRLTYRWPDDTIEIRHVAMTGDLMLNDAEIETYVDALPPAAEPADLEDEVELVLSQREKAKTQEETA